MNTLFEMNSQFYMDTNTDMNIYIFFKTCQKGSHDIWLRLEVCIANLIGHNKFGQKPNRKKQVGHKKKKKIVSLGCTH